MLGASSESGAPALAPYSLSYDMAVCKDFFRGSSPWLVEAAHINNWGATWQEVTPQFCFGTCNRRRPASAVHHALGAHRFVRSLSMLALYNGSESVMVNLVGRPVPRRSLSSS